MKVGDKVQIVKCLPKTRPIKRSQMGKIGTISAIEDDKDPPICVRFKDKSTNAFYIDELFFTQK